MNTTFRQSPLSRLIAGIVLVAFTSLLPAMPSMAQVSFLPQVGSMVAMTPAFQPMVVRGIKLYTNNPFKFDFIVDTGDMELNQQQIKDQGRKLASYFLASLTTPEKQMWVNLSPYEHSRIIPKVFGDTQMGMTLLAEDYMLKQIMATALYPERQLGREFWQKVYAQAEQQFGTTQVPVNTFNKVWIVPDEAVVYENAKMNAVFVVQSRLKVMLEQDYLAANKHKALEQYGMSEQSLENKINGTALSTMASHIIKQIVIPALEKEVNDGKNFAGLRQVYNSLILAAWYKKNLKDNVLVKGYVDRGKTAGVDTKDKKIDEKIYQQYLKAYRKGVYNYVKEESDPLTNEIIPRKYFSGGVGMYRVSAAMTTANAAQLSRFDTAMRSHTTRLALLGVALLLAGGGTAIAAPTHHPSAPAAVHMNASNPTLVHFTAHVAHANDIIEPYNMAADTFNALPLQVRETVFQHAGQVLNRFNEQRRMTRDNVYTFTSDLYQAINDAKHASSQGASNPPPKELLLGKVGTANLSEALSLHAALQGAGLMQNDLVTVWNLVQKSNLTSSDYRERSNADFDVRVFIAAAQRALNDPDHPTHIGRINGNKLGLPAPTPLTPSLLPQTPGPATIAGPGASRGLILGGSNHSSGVTVNLGALYPGFVPNTAVPINSLSDVQTAQNDQLHTYFVVLQPGAGQDAPKVIKELTSIFGVGNNFSWRIDNGTNINGDTHVVEIMVKSPSADAHVKSRLANADVTVVHQFLQVPLVASTAASVPVAPAHAVQAPSAPALSATVLNFQKEFSQVPANADGTYTFHFESVLPWAKDRMAAAFGGKQAVTFTETDIGALNPNHFINATVSAATRNALVDPHNTFWNANENDNLGWFADTFRLKVPQKAAVQAAPPAVSSPTPAAVTAPVAGDQKNVSTMREVLAHQDEFTVSFLGGQNGVSSMVNNVAGSSVKINFDVNPVGGFLSSKYQVKFKTPNDKQGFLTMLQGPHNAQALDVLVSNLVNGPQPAPASAAPAVGGGVHPQEVRVLPATPAARETPEFKINLPSWHDVTGLFRRLGIASPSTSGVKAIGQDNVEGHLVKILPGNANNYVGVMEGQKLGQEDFRRIVETLYNAGESVNGLADVLIAHNGGLNSSSAFALPKSLNYAGQVFTLHFTALPQASATTVPVPVSSTTASQPAPLGPPGFQLTMTGNNDAFIFHWNKHVWQVDTHFDPNFNWSGRPNVIDFLTLHMTVEVRRLPQAGNHADDQYAPFDLGRATAQVQDNVIGDIIHRLQAGQAISTTITGQTNVTIPGYNVNLMSVKYPVSYTVKIDVNGFLKDLKSGKPEAAAHQGVPPETGQQPAVPPAAVPAGQVSVNGHAVKFFAGQAGSVVANIELPNGKNLTQEDYRNLADQVYKPGDNFVDGVTHVLLANNGGVAQGHTVVLPKTLNYFDHTFDLQIPANAITPVPAAAVVPPAAAGAAPSLPLVSFERNATGTFSVVFHGKVEIAEPHDLGHHIFHPFAPPTLGELVLPYLRVQITSGDPGGLDKAKELIIADIIKSVKADGVFGAAGSGEGVHDYSVPTGGFVNNPIGSGTTFVNGPDKWYHNPFTYSWQFVPPGDKAQNVGGIDLEKLFLATRGKGGVRTAFSDPRILKILLNAKGLMPRINSVKPVTVPMVDMLLGFNHERPANDNYPPAANDNNPADAPSKQSTAPASQQVAFIDPRKMLTA